MNPKFLTSFHLDLLLSSQPSSQPFGSDPTAIAGMSPVPKAPTRLGTSNTISDSVITKSDIDGDSDRDIDEDLGRATADKIVCMLVEDCELGGKDFRKCVSHAFGRNKSCTSQIPQEHTLWACRKHYQRLRYHGGISWGSTQIGLVEIQVGMMETWGAVREWEIRLRRSEQKKLVREDAELAKGAQLGKNRGVGAVVATASSGSTLRYLVPYLGRKKTFQDIYLVIHVIRREVARREKTRGIEVADWPGVEFLPSIDKIRWPTKAQRQKAAEKAEAEKMGIYDDVEKVKVAESGKEKVEAKKPQKKEPKGQTTQTKHSAPRETHTTSHVKQPVTADALRVPLSSKSPSSSALNVQPGKVAVNRHRPWELGSQTTPDVAKPQCNPNTENYPFLSQPLSEQRRNELLKHFFSKAEIREALNRSRIA